MRADYLSLGGEWELGDGIPATVPGVVHTDLLRAGRIPDPYLGDNESGLRWIGRAEWRYTRTFDWEPGAHERHELVCEGLDTIATVELNGEVVGHAANQHRTHCFEVTSLLRPGANELAITFASALEYAERQVRRPHVNRHPYNAIRKMACNFGWDWGPDLVTAGIWKPIGIRSFTVARIAAVRPLVTEATAERATVSFAVDLEPTTTPLTVTARVGPFARTVRVPAGARRVTVPVTLERPRLWWPRGYGDQPLYDATVTLDEPRETRPGRSRPDEARLDEARLDEWRGRVGLRTVELDTTGGAFVLRVNGQGVLVRGANWIPDDAFPTRVDARRYAARIADATEAGINLLRVWGGGIYESEDFYRLCDEAGVMVWQDFLFACAAYAEELLWGEVEAEAREAVTRLSQHPSLVLWNGGNENLWGYEDWGWKEQLGDASWGAGFYHDLLPGIVAELDPTRPYIPGSPYSVDGHPNDPTTGLVHIWDVWNEKDYLAYADYTPRFVAEFGFQGAPAWSTLTAAGAVHQKAEDGDGKLRRGWQGHFPDPADRTAWHWTTQLNQAHAITFAVERFRALAPHCHGMILWQLNDCWPVVSWAAVDGYGRRKPLWYALRRAYADRLVTVQPQGLVAVNDTASPWEARLRVRHLRVDGTELASRTLDIDVDARGTATAPLSPDGADVIAVDGSGIRVRHVLARGLPAPAWNATLTRTAGGHLVEIEARTLLRDLTLHADRLHPDAVVDEQLVTLLPGERARFMLTTDVEPDGSEVLSFPILTTANHLEVACAPH
ncbi:glycoside hydrolase family 2 protein [Nonomuraea lactucae]|uniref:glycoside hydrolase family 2 protein n=1 Tax=Nonomuraea lactucae TaxID=2249762 RepID=UPI000DE37DEE|nr:glycoside hydrolase family 2 protein [Nonomuraea lactucae]